ncbi:basic secretory protein-like protein [Mucilaginibacter glaciei]|uniref:Secretory protein n=1 Tax=Mucilaginibacter glaciei TaxID=2772109 RepID=A0A926S1B5_9SPHI|nr:basic secretory protein-like protein [Mucilaginibacter glaciei]MBD1392903.1 secretory protein [Mucilaginibacter glaciei]
MKKIIVIFCLFIAVGARAQERDWKTVGKYISRDSITKNGYTLIFVNLDTTFAAQGASVKKRMVDAFFKVYPEEAMAFNKKTLKKVVFIIDPEYKGVAATADGTVRYSPKWMLKQPLDLDVVTHEVMHIVQDYGDGAGPGWLTEGIADYVRYAYGIDNATAKWSLPALKPTHHYDNAYRITARFLAWIEKDIKKGTVQKLDSRLRAHTYTSDSWKKLTGKTVDELWEAYVAAEPKQG